MAAALAITPASGSIIATVSACRIDVTGADQNDDTAYDPDLYPASPEIRYYVTAEVGGAEKGRSHVFSPNGGKHSYDNYIFPSAGSWTLHLRKVSDDSSVANLAVTVN